MYFVEHQGADLLNEAIVLRVTNESGADADQLHCLLEASKHRQIIIAKTENGEPLVSIAFAKISKYTLRLLAANPEYKLRPHEYREGKILYILDGFFRKNFFKKSLASLVPQLKKYRLIAYVKKGKLKFFCNNNGSIKLVRLPRSWLQSTNNSTI
ncbi:hypothetical protein [Cellvibrio japonicus]|uniref:hypothetical protein n=1 Tax=Cellvibrio japonicus TaxID=155077 RepID=UPI00059FA7AD|nr:hypothetical protein [Cellvibrio japonicus]QEI10997.1 hypothetical protein FY117_01300 [Cellvibrio japonicus]QEI14572.1 hypothetical protein FY116_01300 [Cellvibrio japonicus]QEI18151.1 hypothetical protein FY115_01300 [Cellvibrio japonicus]